MLLEIMLLVLVFSLTGIHDACLQGPIAIVTDG